MIIEKPSQLAPDVAENYIETRRLPDGRFIGVVRLLYHWTLHVDIWELGYCDRYCYPDLSDCIAACRTWNGSGDPPGFWNRHPGSGRRRDRSGREWIEP